jgi:predicted aspartyl protease
MRTYSARGGDFQEIFALLTLLILIYKLVLKNTKKSQIISSQGRIEPAIVVRALRIYHLSYRLNPFFFNPVTGAKKNMLTLENTLQSVN